LVLWVWQNKMTVYCIGKLLICCTPKKHNKWAWMWKQCCFFNYSSIVLWISSIGKMVNQPYYLEVLGCTSIVVQRKWLEMWHLHHYSAPACTVFSIWEFLVKYSVPLIPRPPIFAWPPASRLFFCSPD
jgi:hypothetical protein